MDLLNNTNVFTDNNTMKSGFPSMSYLTVVGLSLLSVFTIIGNMFVVIAYYKNKFLQTTTNYFIVSLAISDLCVGIISVNFYTVYLVSAKVPFHEIICDILLVIDYSVCQASGFNLVVIAFNRYLKVKYPIQYRVRQTKQIVKRSIIALWVLSFLIWTLSVFIYPYVNGERKVPKDKCYLPFLYDSWSVTIVTAIIHFFLPAFLMILIYVSVLLALLDQHVKIKRHPMSSFCDKNLKKVVPLIKITLDGETIDGSDIENSGNNEYDQQSVTSSFYDSDLGERNEYYNSIAISVLGTSKTKASIGNNNNKIRDIDVDKKTISQKGHGLAKIKAHKRAIVLLTIVLVAYIVTYLPYSIMTVITAFCNECIGNDMWNFGYVFCYVNSLLNPFCYALGNRKFKRSFKRMLHCCFKN